MNAVLEENAEREERTAKKTRGRRLSIALHPARSRMTVDRS